LPLPGRPGMAPSVKGHACVFHHLPGHYRRPWAAGSLDLLLPVVLLLPTERWGPGCLELIPK
jgi:hypothetical protein